MTKQPTNLAASVHRRLLDGARTRAEDFQLTLLRYGCERLLYRLGSSPHASAFVLKGAMLFLLWQDQLYRPTRDIDLEGFGDVDADRLRQVFVEICSVDCPEDALRFDADTVAAQPIRTAHDHGGMRVTLLAWLGKARIPLQIDIAFGDAITPQPKLATLPTLLPLPPPRLRTYPLETVVAEKFEAMVRFGRANSRMKDLRDLAMLAARCTFDGELLARAVQSTLAHRRTDVALAADALTEVFFEDAALAQRWRAFVHQQPTADEALAEFAAVGKQLRRFLLPLAEAVAGKRRLGAWTNPNGWNDASP